LSGEDTLILGLLAIGGHGVVSVISHLCGQDLVAMFDAFTNGDMEKAAALSRQVSPLQPAIFAAPNPVPVKTALALTRLKGKIGAKVRLPLVSLSDEENALLRTRLQAAGYGE